MYTTYQVNMDVKQTEKGLAIDTITMGVQFFNGDNRVSGQVILKGDEDGIDFATPLETISQKAIEKAKYLVANSEKE